RLVFDSKNDISRHFKTTENTLTVLHLHLDEIFEPGENTIEAIRSLIQNPSTITVVFDERGILNHFPIGFEKSGHLIYVGGKSEFHQSLAAQLIFGGVGTHRQLGNDLNEHFKKGEGLHSPGGLRLRYSPPQVLGMDARLLRDSIGAIAKMGIDSGAFPGCQVLVAKNGHVVFHETWGFHTYDKKQPV